MKTFRSLLILGGLSVALFALGATGARAQVLESTPFAGTFTLPLDAQWGTATLPAGDYTLRYGHLPFAGPYAVEIVGEAKGSPRSVILAGRAERTSATKNAIVCIREGGTLIVRTLELPAIGESASFALPRGVKLMANKRNHSTYAQLAGGPMLIQRVPVQMSGK